MFIGRFQIVGVVGSLLYPCLAVGCSSREPSHSAATTTRAAGPPSPSPTPSPKTASPPEKGAGARPPFKSFAVYALSRAKGVPPEAREALRKVRELVEVDRSRGLGVRVESRRLGIEGEMRICSEYDDPRDAGRAFKRASELVKGVDLVNLVVEPCDKPEGPEEEAEP